jgi:hypothetical protein
MNEATVFVNLRPGVCAKVTVQVIEEAMPTPHEKCHRREPTVTEFDAVTGKLSAKDYRCNPPFDVTDPIKPPVVPNPRPSRG